MPLAIQRFSKYPVAISNRERNNGPQNIAQIWAQQMQYDENAWKRVRYIRLSDEFIRGFDTDCHMNLLNQNIAQMCMEIRMSMN